MGAWGGLSLVVSEVVKIAGHAHCYASLSSLGCVHVVVYKCTTGGISSCCSVSQCSVQTGTYDAAWPPPT